MSTRKDMLLWLCIRYIGSYTPLVLILMVKHQKIKVNNCIDLISSCVVLICDMKYHFYWYKAQMICWENITCICKQSRLWWRIISCQWNLVKCYILSKSMDKLLIMRYSSRLLCNCILYTHMPYVGKDFLSCTNIYILVVRAGWNRLCRKSTICHDGTFRV